MPPQLEAFDHVHIFVTDRAAAEVWDHEVLGFDRVKELEFQAPNGGPLILKNHDDSIHLALFERPKLPCSSTIALRSTAAEYHRRQGVLPHLPV